MGPSQNKGYRKIHLAFDVMVQNCLLSIKKNRRRAKNAPRKKKVVAFSVTTHLKRACTSPCSFVCRQSQNATPFFCCRPVLAGCVSSLMNSTIFFSDGTNITLHCETQKGVLVVVIQLQMWWWWPALSLDHIFLLKKRFVYALYQVPNTSWRIFRNRTKNYTSQPTTVERTWSSYRHIAWK